jgi:uncharacterized protein (TIGR02246 family)
MKVNLATCIFVLSLQAIFAQTKSDEQLIRESRAASNSAIAKKDIDGVSSFWLPDFVQVRGNGTTENGKEAITATWKDLFINSPATSFIRTPTEIIVSINDATLAWERGTWEGINAYSKGGNYSAMWRKKDGVWKIQAELYVALR